MVWNREIETSIISVLMLIVIILLFLKREKLKPYGYKIISAIGLSLIIDIIAGCIRRSDEISKIYIAYLYYYGMLFIFYLIILLLYKELTKNPRLKRISKFIVIIFLLNFCIGWFFVNLQNGFPIGLLCVNALLMLISISLFLLNTFETDLVLEIKHYYPFWFALGLIVIQIGMIPLLLIQRISTTAMTTSLWTSSSVFS